MFVLTLPARCCSLRHDKGGSVAESEFEPVGLAEIAKRLGVKSQTANMWRHRSRLPEPAGTVSGTPWWDWAEIEKWARATGRERGQR